MINIEGWAQPPVSGARQHFFKADGKSACGTFAWLGSLSEVPLLKPMCVVCAAVVKHLNGESLGS